MQVFLQCLRLLFFFLRNHLASDRLINFTHVLCVDLRFVFRLAKSVSSGSDLNTFNFINSLTSGGLII